MVEGQQFVDYYGILQVRPDCDQKMLEAAYRYLAKMYHPDHPESADPDKFNEVVEAYRNLRVPEDRASYDKIYREHRQSDPDETTTSEETVSDDAPMLDSEAHEKILLRLYKRRRENARNPGVLGFYLKELLNCSEENFEFHIWYLKSKGFIEGTEQGELAITIEGVDHVISMSRTTAAEQLLIAKPEE
jgi:curved DNA-binding protein